MTRFKGFLGGLLTVLALAGSWNETKAPSITVSDAPKYIASTFQPSPITPFRSMVKVSKTSDAGSSTRLATGL